MATYIKIQTTGTISKKIDKRLKDLPKMTRVAMRAWGNALAVSMVRSAKASGIQQYTGNLFNSIKWEQTESSNYGQLVMPDYGVMLDRMAIHRWWFRRQYGMRLRWAAQARNDMIRELARDVKHSKRDKFFIWVRPHPFIRTGYQTARKKLPAILKEYTVNRTI